MSEQNVIPGGHHFFDGKLEALRPAQLYPTSSQSDRKSARHSASRDGGRKRVLLALTLSIFVAAGYCRSTTLPHFRAPASRPLPPLR